MRFSILLATSALVLGVASANAGDRPRNQSLELVQKAGGLAVANIGMREGDNNGFISQEGSETHLNLNASGLWNDFGAIQKSETKATIDANLYSWSGNGKLVFDVEAYDTSTIDARVNGVQAVVGGTQKAGGDVTFKGGTGGNNSIFKLEQVSDQGSAYTDYFTVTDEGAIAVLEQTAPGETKANIDMDMGYSPNWDRLKPYKDAAK